MRPQKPQSLQEVLKQQRVEEFREGFFGRGEEVRRFRENLALPPEKRRFVFNIHGQGGVGKSFLLQRFTQLAEEQHVLCPWSNEDQHDVVAVLVKTAQQLKALGVRFKAFDERYRTYQQKRDELEKDPELPPGLFDLMGKSATRLTLFTAAHVAGPVAPALALINPDELGSRMGEAVAFITRKLKKKDDIQLVREPVAVLTPYWLEAVAEACEDKSIILFFDGFESTGEFMDPWLRDLIKGEYGATPLGLLFVVAGQHELPRGPWRDFEPILSRLEVEPFTEEETHAFLKRRGLTNPETLSEIFHKTQGLPAVLDLFANVQHGGSVAVDPNDTAIQHFLKGVESTYQQVALNAALPRRINRDILAELTQEDGADVLFEWLKRQPFMQRREAGRTYHPVVRHLMLAYKLEESPESWARLHRKLGDYHARRQEQLGLTEGERITHAPWREHALELLYHRVCESPPLSSRIALNGFLDALRFQTSFARSWAETLMAAEKDAQCKSDRWGERLVQALKEADEGQFTAAISTFTAVLQRTDLKPTNLATAFGLRGALHRSAHQLEQSVEDCSRAIELAPDDLEHLLSRGRTLFLLQRHEEALVDLSSVIERGRPDPGPYEMRSLIFSLQRRHEEAAADLKRLSTLAPQSFALIWLRLMAALSQKDLQLTLEILTQISDPAAQYLEDLKRMAQAISAHLTKAELQFILPRMGVSMPSSELELERQLTMTLEIARGNLAPLVRSIQANALTIQSEIHKNNQEFDQALAFIDQALKLTPDEPLLLTERADLRAKMGQSKEALEDFARAEAMDPMSTPILVQRGAFQLSLGHRQEALNDFDRAIALKPEVRTLLHRSILHRLEGRFAQALDDIHRAIVLEPANTLLVLYKLPLQQSLGDSQGFVESYATLAANAPQFVQSIKAFATGTEPQQRATQLYNLLVGMGTSPAMTTALLERLSTVVESAPDEGECIVRADAAIVEAGHLLSQKRFPESLEAFARAIAIEPDQPFHRIRQAFAYKRMGRNEDALATVEGLQAAPVADIQLACAVILMDAGRLDAALASVERALAFNPSLAAAHGVKGTIFVKQRLYAKALVHLSSALELDPHLTPALKTLQKVYWIQDQYSEALKELEKSSSATIWSPWDPHNEKGELLLRMGRHTEAQDAYRRLLDQSPDNWRAAYNLTVLRALQEGLPMVADALADVQSRLVTERATGGAAVLVRLAGLEALTGSPVPAFRLLREALVLEPEILHWAKGDLAWGATRDDPQFQVLLAEWQPPPGA